MVRRLALFAIIAAAPAPAAAEVWSWAARFDRTTGLSSFRAGIAGVGGSFEFGCTQGRATWMRLRPTGYFEYGREGDQVEVAVSTAGRSLDEGSWIGVDGGVFSTRPLVGRLLRVAPPSRVRFVISFDDETPPVEMQVDMSGSAEVLREAQRTCSLDQTLQQ